jgi:hypothetical protein
VLLLLSRCVCVCVCMCVCVCVCVSLWISSVSSPNDWVSNYSFHVLCLLFTQLPSLCLQKSARGWKPISFV